VWNATAEDELYHLDQDPGELTNLAGDPAFRRDLMRMKSKLLAWMERTKDRVLNLWTRRQLMNG
jgi:hypothetical protein